MKNLNEILFIVQARVNSERAPKKMIRPFAGTNLFDIALKKIKQSKIPLANFRASVYEQELIDICDANDVLYYKRSHESANNDTSLQKIYEWHDQFPQYKYAVIINACNLFLEADSIDKFIDEYISNPYDGLFAVMPKKQYYWDTAGSLISKWPTGNNIMNTKAVETIYEAGHVLYAGKLEKIKNGVWMGKPPYSNNNPKLFEISEFECLDIDHEWQFDLYTNYWEKING